MNLGVLLVYFQEGRTTRFTRDWAERAIGRVANYIFEQSGGRETITYKVFDWIKLPLTEAEWSGLGEGAYDKVRPTIEQKIGEKLDPFTHILIGVDHSKSSGGTTPNVFTYLAASNFTPSLVAHELGHRYGADDAYRETAKGPEIYKNQFCVMGALGWPAVFVDNAIADPTAQGLNLSGPGMSAPTLMATGWLNEGEHGVAVDLSETDLISGSGFGSGFVQELSVLAGAPGPTQMRPPVVVRYRDLVIEYRIKASDGWDGGLPNPGPGAGGWVVVHRSKQDAPRALHVDSVAARPGATMVLGNDLDLFNPGPLKISVVSFDAKACTVRLNLTRRPARPALSGTTFGGVEVGGGGLVYTLGRGITRVPPHSPLINVLDELARIQALQEMMALASGDEVDGLFEEATDALRSLEHSVAGLRIEPSVSLLAHALENISKLHSTSEELESSPDDREATRTFVEASRQQLAEVKQILARAVEEERQR
jgi:hypothetical protein